MFNRFRVMTAVAIIVACGFGLAHAGQASAALKHIDGRCGIHKGAGVIPYTNRFHVRIGVKNSTSGGSHRCFGYYVPKGARAGGLCCSFPWHTFDFTSWNWHGIIEVGAATTFTTISCAGFAAAFAGEFPTGLLDTAATAAAGAGCVGGSKLIQTAINSNFYARR